MSGPVGMLQRLGPALALAVLLGALPMGVSAQDAPGEPVGAAILIVDQTRLFRESAFGRASLAKEEDAARALEAENSRIQAELVTEEQELTFLRKTLSAEDFSARAEAFDQKVERIRAEQDAKARDLTQARDETGRAFVAAVKPILDAILQDRGALVLMDKSVVIQSQASIDVTDEAIMRVDKVLAAPTEPAP
jgi:Skp family chaperone for outer membrane proteins